MTVHGSNYGPSTVGQIIREYRKAQGITQKQLASKLGVEARTLRMYENGERVLENISDLLRIADLLAIDPTELGLAARRQEISTARQLYEVIERVATLLQQARFMEARTTIDTLIRGLKKLSTHEDSIFLRALASAYCMAGHVHAITRRTREVEHMLHSFQAMEQLARQLDDQTLLNIARSFYGDMLRRRGDVVQAIGYLERARDATPLADATAQGNNALLTARARLANNDYSSFERELAEAEELARSLDPLLDNGLTLFSLGTVYEEYARGYGKCGKLEKCLHYLQLAERHLPANNLWRLLLQATHAEALLHAGEIASAMPLLIEAAHLAQMYGHQSLVERLFRLQYYLEDQATLMRQASRSLSDVLLGPIEP